MNSDNIILRGTENPPLINKDDLLSIAEIDGNFISIYNDFVALSNAEDTTLTFDVDRTYLVGEYATYDGRMWVATEISTGVTPIEGSADWNDIFPTILAHEKNKDTILDEGGVNETTVAEIRAFIDAGLTSTTNLSLSTKTATSFKIESSTGADVTIPQANGEEAGLLNATDKVKLNNLTGVNTGDQTLISLNAEDVDNKVTDFTTINNTLYPTTQAVDTYITAVVPDLVDTFIGGLVAQDLQDVTTVGNTTTDNIAFTGAVGVLFDNTSTLRKGTIDAGYGGAKGIAQICSVGYELKWEAGRLYVMGDGGTTIREVSHNFTTTPSATDDNTKGFIVGSRWILDNGDLYVCTDTTTATAVWVLQTITTADIADSLNKRYVTDANLTVIGNTSGTNTGDQVISDATITTTDITTNNFTTAKHGFVPKGTNVGNFLKDDGTWGTPASGGSGVCGIANSSGVYTYYATLSLAITAATSGQTVDLLTNITETGSVTLLPTSGIRINGNGYTYTLSVNDGTHAISWNYYNIELFNLKVVRTGRALNSTGTVFSKNDTGSLLTLKCQNVVFQNTYGIGVSANNTKISGLTIDSYGDGVFSTFDSIALNNCIITSTNAYGVNLPNSSFDIVNCNVTGSTFGILNGGGNVYNSIGKTSSGAGISATYGVTNSTGISSSGNGVQSNNGNNCVGISTSAVGLSGTFKNSTGISTSGYAGSGGTKTNCTLISSSNYASFQENLNNTFLQSTTNVPLWLSTDKLVNSCTAICLWNNASGHAINTTAAATGVDVRNCNLTVTNASAYCINGAAASTFKYANNSFKGSTVAVNATNITQGITNISDTKGNILI
jgi:hypothetical protein